MKRAPLSTRDRRAILLGLAVLVPPLLYIGGIRPYTAAVAEYRDRLATDRLALARERALLALAPQSATLQQALDSVIAGAQARLFGAHDDGIAGAALASYLTGLAREHQVWLRAADAGEIDVSTGGVRSLPVEIRAESDIDGILGFLRAVEHGPKMLRVDRLAISAAGDTSVSARALELRATVTGYALRGTP